MSDVAPAVADPLKDATAADSRGDYAAAFRLLNPLAAQGNARAQDALGYSCMNEVMAFRGTTPRQ